MCTALPLTLENKERRPQELPQRIENVVHLWTLCCLAFEQSQRATSFVLLLQQVSPEQGGLRYGASTLRIDTRKQACTDRNDHCIARGNACCPRARSYGPRSDAAILPNPVPAPGPPPHPLPSPPP